ncbi:hypothetical protein MJO28_007357 [Puccinia striiformis f. sp. tritici]|uniref:Uncharacterized protein n=1 Tax=Puccinia striiformis f. sp. tritici TaxID=168172 RepID=A0ACC0EFF9_9BASI|nr:hypothetical protein MJO28_007357 [Puccinia striiformis f. sp. tritici]
MLANQPFQYTFTRLDDATSDRLTDSNKALLIRFCASLLPSLHQQIGCLAKLLDPSELAQTPSAQLKLIERCQREIDGTLDEIMSSKNEIYSTSYLCYIFNLNLWPTICDGFRKYNELLQQLDLSTEKSQEPINITLARKKAIDCTTAIQDQIDSTINIINGSDLQNNEYGWSHMIPGIDHGMRDLFKMMQDAQRDPSLCPNDTTIDPVVQVGRALIPVMKLSRTFLNKLLDPKLHTSQSDKFTKNFSSQLRNQG